MRKFENFVCIDWSGEAVERPTGLAMALARAGDNPPSLIGAGDRWSRQSILEWMLAQAQASQDVLIALDLSPSLPFVDEGAFFPGWPDSPLSAKELWQLVDGLSVDTPYLGSNGALAHSEIYRHFRHHKACGDLFPSGPGRFRRCELGQRKMGLSPYSCFNLVGAAQVGKSSLTGMRVLHRLQGRVPVWPFDPVPDSGPLIVEIYTSLSARQAALPKGRSKIFDPALLDQALSIYASKPHTPLARYTDHATDAILTAAWLRANADRPELWQPEGMAPEVARTEGWTFGVV